MLWSCNTQLCTETLMASTICWFMRDVRKGATLLTGEAGGVPLRNYFPFLNPARGMRGWSFVYNSTGGTNKTTFCTRLVTP